jgi:UDP-2,4-diacetamido-2,4,6-trideoxy-beta-L-altropyranose hydrolase
MSKLLVIRADAGVRMGTGHVMRCLALAQEWQDTGGTVAWVTSCDNERIVERLREEGLVVHRLETDDPGEDWDVTRSFLDGHAGPCLAVDGYHFDSEYQKRAKEAGYRLLAIDDHAHLDRYCADLVVNQNLHAADLHYVCEAGTRLLMGPRYALLRREFLKFSRWEREIATGGGKVLVTLGGADPDNVAFTVLDALEQLASSELEVTIVLGLANESAKAIRQRFARSSGKWQLLNSVGWMPELMQWADVAVSGAGITSWEIAFMGLPSLLVVLADNQTATAERLAGCQAAWNLGWHRDLSPAKLARKLRLLLDDAEVRTHMARTGRSLVDGEGGARVVTALAGNRIRLRAVRDGDRLVLWQWTNDPDVRRAAFQNDPISWETHVAWFDARRKDPNCRMFMVVDSDDLPVGQLRFEMDGERQAEIDVSIVRERRGRSYAAEALRLSFPILTRSTACARLIARVRHENAASIRAFEKAGFDHAGRESVGGVEAVRLVWESGVRR